MSHSKSRKRNFRESNEFQPLTKGKLFQSDDENNCEYDWGFKKSTKPSQSNPTFNTKTSKTTDNVENVNKKMIYHKSIKPYEIKNDKEREMYMENLAKVYERSYVYIPSFYNVNGLDENIDKLIDQSFVNFFNAEIKSISILIDTLWKPLNDSYVTTKRLSENCAAYKLIVKCLPLYTKMKQLYENALEKGDTDYKSQLKAWEEEKVDTITKQFQNITGNILLEFKDSPEVIFEEMTKDSVNSIFIKMVKEDISQKQASVGTRKAKNKEDKAIESKPEEEPNESNDNRPASKALLENRGLVPKRKKADANPRVKHRMKFKKALVRYHSQVPRTRDDAGNYQGEKSGIRAAVIRAQKFK